MQNYIDELLRLSKIAATHPSKIFKAGLVFFTQGPKVVRQKIKRQDIIHDYSGFINTQYLKWIKRNFPKESDLLKQRRTRFKLNPKISILTPTFNTDERFLREAVESVLDQSYINWELCLADDASTNPKIRDIITSFSKKDSRIKYVFREKNGHISQASNSALSLATGEFIALLDHDDYLWPNALYEVVKVVNENPKANFIYSDEDKIEQDSRLHTEPFFKPDFSPNYLRSVNYIIHLSVIRKRLVNKVGGFRVGIEGAQDWDLFLRVIRGISDYKTVIHIPKILYSWRKSSTSAAMAGVGENIKKYAFKNQKKVLQDDLLRAGLSGKVLPTRYLGLWRVKHEILGNPKISIIIPTKDSYEYISRCLNSILEKKSYINYQLIIVDNGSKDERVWTLYKEFSKKHQDTKILIWEKQFNFAAVCNLGAAAAAGRYLLFLNNDTEIMASNWIENMLEFAQMKEVGAVGCKLIFPNKRIQHAGIVLGIAGGLVKKGVAGHPFKNFYNNTINNGYSRVADTIRECSGVTAACLLISKEKFNKAGGFDVKFRIAFNDVDFCLKLRKLGFLNIYTPYALVKHWESVSVGLPGQKGRKVKEFLEEVAMMHLRWGKWLLADPYYNKNLSLKNEEYSLKEN